MTFANILIVLINTDRAVINTVFGILLSTCSIFLLSPSARFTVVLMLTCTCPAILMAWQARVLLILVCSFRAAVNAVFRILEKAIYILFHSIRTGIAIIIIWSWTRLAIYMTDTNIRWILIDSGRAGVYTMFRILQATCFVLFLSTRASITIIIIGSRASLAIFMTRTNVLCILWSSYWTVIDTMLRVFLIASFILFLSISASNAIIIIRPGAGLAIFMAWLASVILIEKSANAAAINTTFRIFQNALFVFLLSTSASSTIIIIGPEAGLAIIMTSWAHWILFIVTYRVFWTFWHANLINPTYAFWMDLIAANTWE